MTIASVIVTFNRLMDLKKAIQKYEEQTFLPSYMIIVDNCSNDGTKEYLDKWKTIEAPFEKIVMHLPKNIGGSGGFYEGIKCALNTDCDWYWIADDDAFLASDALEQMVLFEKKHPKLIEECSALCGTVVRNPESMEIDLGHRRKIEKKFGMPKQTVIPADAYNQELIQVGLFTFVGSMIKAESVKHVGLPHGDFFIYFDDLEYAYRVGKCGSMYCVTSCKIYHDTAKHEEKYGSTWRSYYQSRNMLFFYKAHFPVAYYKVIIKRFIQRVFLKVIGKYSMANQLDWDAMWDAIKNRKGISDKYYIGWKEE